MDQNKAAGNGDQKTDKDGISIICSSVLREKEWKNIPRSSWAIQQDVCEVSGYPDGEFDEDLYLFVQGAWRGQLPKYGGVA